MGREGKEKKGGTKGKKGRGKEIRRKGLIQGINLTGKKQGLIIDLEHIAVGEIQKVIPANSWKDHRTTDNTQGRRHSGGKGAAFPHYFQEQKGEKIK